MLTFLPGRSAKRLIPFLLACLSVRQAGSDELFYRGDCNFSREQVLAVDAADAAAIMSYLYGQWIEKFEPPCLDACDCDDNGLIDVRDATCVLAYFFAFGALPSAPGPGWSGQGLDIQPTPPGSDPTADALDCKGGGGGLETRELCLNGIDDDGDLLADGDDPDCQLAFACGPVTEGFSPWDGTLKASIGSAVRVGFYLMNPEDHASAGLQSDHIQGLSIALAYAPDLIAREGTLDISGTIIEALDAEYVTHHADNDPTDGDGCELVIGVLMDALLPFSGERIPPLPVWQLVGSIEFEVKDDPGLCGACMLVKFVDGVNGRGAVPVRNLVVSLDRSRSPAQFFDCEVCAVEKPRFFRGDCNFSNGGPFAVDLADAAATVSFLLGVGPGKFMPPCLDACDCNDDGMIDINDAICVLQYYCEGGSVPPPPGPGWLFQDAGDGGVVPAQAGMDPTPDLLDCNAGTSCPRSAGMADAMAFEVCDNGLDDDGGMLFDREDPDCMQSFAFGARNLATGGLPGPMNGLPGSDVEVCFFILTREDNFAGAWEQHDHVQGFSMALTYDCALKAREKLDIAGTILEALDAEYTQVSTDNAPTDGDGCEIIISAVVDLFEPYERLRISPLDMFQRVGCVPFTVPEDAPCGSCYEIMFADGVNGRHRVPVSNLVAVEGASHPALLVASGGLCVGNVDRDGDGRADACDMEPVPFKRADANADGSRDITDGIFILNYLFLNGARPPCLDASDVNDSGRVDISDGVYMFTFLFLGGEAPRAPFETCGEDPTMEDALQCAAFMPCTNP